jgi:thioredoxin reductase
MADELDIIIVGAGLSGLSAAIQCALSGHSVTVLESTKELAEVLLNSTFKRHLNGNDIRSVLASNSRRTPPDSCNDGASTTLSKTKSVK